MQNETERELAALFDDIGEVADAAPYIEDIKEILAEEAIRERMAKALRFMFAPGRLMFTDGEKGRGKTHQSVAYGEILVKGELYPEAGKYEVITNVLMLKKIADTGRDEDDFMEECPPGFHFASSFTEVFETIAEILERDRGTRIIWILDEVQNYIISERNSAKLNVMFLQLLGVIRKFNICMWMLSPATSNVSYRVRNFNDDPKETGNVNILWSFDYGMAEAYIRINDLDTEPYQYTTAQYGIRGRKHLFFVPATPYTRPTPRLRVGEYTYDHTSLASFEAGHDEFDMGKFLAKFKKVQSARIPGLIREYLRSLGSAADDHIDTAENVLLKAQMDRADRWRSQNRSWREIGDLEGVPWKTIYNRFRKFYGLKDGELPED